MLQNLKCEAKMNVASGSALKKVEDRNCPQYHVHENNNWMEQSKFVATKQDSVNS